MVSHNSICGGRALRIAVGITALVLLLAGGAGAPSDINISPQSDINNRFIMHRLDAGIPSHREFGMPFRNLTGELTGRGLNAEYRYGRIPENISLPPVRYIEKAAYTITSIITVNASGGADYTRIQDAINASNDGDTILVQSGTYYENVDVNKQLTLRGVDTGGGKPVVIAGGTGSAITLSAGWSTLEGFAAKNSGNNWQDAGIRINSNNNIVKNNLASDNYHGIELFNGNNNTLSGNTMIGNMYNFWLNGYYNSDFDNQIDYSNTVDGKPIYYVKNAKNTVYDSSTNAGTFYCIDCLNVTIKNMKLLKNEVGIFFMNTTGSRIQNVTASNNSFGIIMALSSNNTLSGNNASNNYHVGIHMDSSSNNTLSGNNASNNYGGIDILSSSNNTLSGNNASNNEEGIILFSSGNNTLSGNTASNNLGYGIDLEYSSNNNTLSGNNASNNWVGIYVLEYSSNNNIYNNVFNNTNNFYIENSVSTWNITKTSGTNIIGGPYLGGNVWAYPNGTGFSQIQTCADNNGDDICDSIYTLDGSNIDYLPLAYKFTSTPTANVSISGFSFQPQTINVTAGTTVTWTNLDSVTHTVTSDTGLFDSGSLSTGQTFSRTFNTAGSYDYHCSIHPSMTGSVIVTSDNPPPASISTPQASRGTTWINWSWNNPPDPDFSHVIVYIDNSFAANVNAPLNYYNATGFAPGTTHTISTKTADTAGNINQTWVNNTAATLSTGETKGDVNRNGRRDTGDATLILRSIVGLPIPSQYLPIIPIGDMNCNNRIDTGDATLVLRDIVSLPIPRCWE